MNAAYMRVRSKKKSPQEWLVSFSRRSQKRVRKLLYASLTAGKFTHKEKDG